MTEAGKEYRRYVLCKCGSRDIVRTAMTVTCCKVCGRTQEPVNFTMGQSNVRYKIDRLVFYRLLEYRRRTGLPLRWIVRRALEDFLQNHPLGVGKPSATIQ